jgi:TatD DNase family protein
LIKHGFSLSFGAALLDEQKKASEVLRLLPHDRFFLESDESAITISEIYQTAAKIKNISVEELKKMIYQNFKNCFGDIYYE